MKFLFLLWFTAFSTIVYNSAIGQVDLVVKTNYSGLTFGEFVIKIEEQSDYNIFYNPIWTDSLVINFNTDNKKVEEILSQLFSGTELNFAVDTHKNIFITYRRRILNELPNNFFNLQYQGQNLAFDYSD